MNFHQTSVFFTCFFCYSFKMLVLYLLLQIFSYFAACTPSSHFTFLPVGPSFSHFPSSSPTLPFFSFSTIFHAFNLISLNFRHFFLRNSSLSSFRSPSFVFSSSSSSNPHFIPSSQISSYFSSLLSLPPFLYSFSTSSFSSPSISPSLPHSLPIFLVYSTSFYAHTYLSDIHSPFLFFIPSFSSVYVYSVPYNRPLAPHLRFRRTEEAKHRR